MTLLAKIYGIICSIFKPIAPVLLVISLATSYGLWTISQSRAILAKENASLVVQLEDAAKNLDKVKADCKAKQVEAVATQKQKDTNVEKGCKDRIVIRSQQCPAIVCQANETSINIMKQRLPDEVLESLDYRYTPSN